MDGQTTRLSEDAAVALYRAELEDEPEVDWDKARALAAEGRAQVVRDKYVEFADAAAMDANFKEVIERLKDDRAPSRLIWPASAILAKHKRS